MEDNRNSHRSYADMKLNEALKRIEELERKVAELEARPRHEYVTVYQYVPQIPLGPLESPFAPLPWQPTTC